jgi:hypothetical protein
MRVSDATLTLVVKVLALDRDTKQQKVLGYATFNVFCLARSRAQPFDPNLAYPDVHHRTSTHGSRPVLWAAC